MEKSVKALLRDTFKQKRNEGSDKVRAFIGWARSRSCQIYFQKAGPEEADRTRYWPSGQGLADL
jgi:hypothetical protein